MVLHYLLITYYLLLINFNLSTSLLTINFIITYQLDLETSYSFHFVAEFIAISCRLLDAINPGYFV